MALPVITVASGGLPVADVTAIVPARGMPITEVASRGMAVTKVSGILGLPVVYVTADGQVVPPITPTTLNPADKEAHISLSGGNLTATGTAGWTGLVRAIASQTAGKFYWETTFNAAAVQTGPGVALGTLPVTTTFGTVSTGHCGLIKDGLIRVNGATTFTIDGTPGSSVSFGSIASGTVICIAVDMTTAKKIWFRLGAAGNWNNVGSRNPATGVGGVDIPTITTAYPALCFGGLDTLIANFGATAFSGAVPSGFTAGWG